eukprot:Gb_38164 [translate_table: standard]
MSQMVNKSPKPSEEKLSPNISQEVEKRPLVGIYLKAILKKSTVQLETCKKAKSWDGGAFHIHHSLIQDLLCGSEGPVEEFEKVLNKGTTSIHVTALDGLVSVNSLFTVAVFVGLSLATPGQRSLEDTGACDAGEDIAKNLLVFEVVAFSSFLFSSLIAQGLKLAIILNNSKEVTEAFKAHINNALLRLGMLASAFGSVMGCIFLVLSMVNVIQIRLGLLSCGSASAARATIYLVSLVSTALVMYISTVINSQQEEHSSMQSFISKINGKGLLSSKFLSMLPSLPGGWQDFNVRALCLLLF